MTAPDARSTAAAVFDRSRQAARLLSDRTRPLGPGVKGFTGLADATAESLTGRSIFDVLTGPFAVIRERELDDNAALMAAYCADHGMEFAPHVKTTMSPQIFARQLQQGAWALTAATIGQLAVYREYGVRRVLLANQLVDETAIDYLADELQRDPTFTPYLWVDSLAGVDLLERRLRKRGCEQRVNVVIELGVPGGRTGARTVPEALSVARRAAAGKTLRVAGAAGFEGSAAEDVSAAGLAAVGQFCRDLRSLAECIAEEFEFTVADPPIITAGGSTYFDVVTDVLAPGAPCPAGEGMARNDGPPTGSGLRVVLRSGSYIAHDDGHIDELSPYHRGSGPEFGAAVAVWAHVVSTPEVGLGLLCAGKRDLSYDIDLPVVRGIRHSSAGSTTDNQGIRVTGLNDQHAFVSVPRGADLAVGDLVCLGISHPCTAFDKWRVLAIVDENNCITDIAYTFF